LKRKPSTLTPQSSSLTPHPSPLNPSPLSPQPLTPLPSTPQPLNPRTNAGPGSCFWLPHGTRIYNKLVDFIRVEYFKRGYQEVITPNVFNLKLWEISGHAAHYKDNMFIFNVEGQEFGMKPMNCPGHCLMFGMRQVFYKHGLEGEGDG
jgi:hypothetical protein